MRTTPALAAALVLVGACNGGGSATSHRSLSLALTEGSEIHARSGQISSVYLVAFEATGPVSFEVADAPAFVSVHGDVLQIAPQRSDGGARYPITLSVTDGVNRDSKHVTLVIDSSNQAPLFVTAYAADSRGRDPYLSGCVDSVSVWGTLSDLSSEHDAARLEVELAQGDAAFTGRPTQTSPPLQVYRNGYVDQAFLDFELQLTDLLPGQPYRLAMRAVDDFGGSTEWRQPTSAGTLGTLVSPDRFTCAFFAPAIAGAMFQSLDVGAPPGETRTFTFTIDGTVSADVAFFVAGPQYVHLDGSTLAVSPPADATPATSDYYMVEASSGGVTARAFGLVNISCPAANPMCWAGQ